MGCNHKSVRRSYASQIFKDLRQKGIEIKGWDELMSASLPSPKDYDVAFVRDGMTLEALFSCNEPWPESLHVITQTSPMSLRVWKWPAWSRLYDDVNAILELHRLPASELAPLPDSFWAEWDKKMK